MVTSIAKLRKLQNQHEHGRFYSTLTNYTFDLFDGNSVRIPKGFKYDKASVPRFLWSLMPPSGDDTAAFLLHDYTYHLKGKIITENGSLVKISRKRSDFLMFIYQCLLLDINSSKIFDKNFFKRLRIVAMYIGVRIGGWYYWADTPFEKLLQKYITWKP
tara:strand:- start:468 stop:944 length:477 start_codon:yes stop_codon:yes gene_type:complete